MACGTGKTLVALWAAERLGVKSVLVLVPSLALVRQTLHEWLKETRWDNFSYLCVCSDPSVTRGADNMVVRQSDLDFPVTTDSSVVKEYLSSSSQGVRVIFSTYQSAQVVAEGIPKGASFDLGLFDEAHKTAGREGTRFSFALKDDNLPILKRLFMTATPRHYDVRKKDKEGDTSLVSEQSRGAENSSLSIATIALIAFWVIGIVDSYRVGRVVEKVDEAPVDKKT